MVNPTNPYEVGYYVLPDYATDVAVAGGYVWVADGADGLHVLQYYGTGVEESPRPRAASPKPSPTVIRGVLPKLAAGCSRAEGNGAADRGERRERSDTGHVLST